MFCDPEIVDVIQGKAKNICCAFTGTLPGEPEDHGSAM